MLDLKAKLAAAGLVTPAEVAAAERKSGPARGGNRSDNRGPDHRGPDHRGPDHRDTPRPRPGPQSAERGKPAAPRSGLDIPALQKAGKGAAYDTIRRVIERARLDPMHAIPGEQAEAFHFTTASGLLSRLMLEPGARAQLGDGSAGMVAFMSHHGLAHCVVPRVLAEDIARLFPFWLRVLKDHPGAGQQEPPPPPRPPRDPAPQAAMPDARDLDARDLDARDPDTRDPDTRDRDPDTRDREPRHSDPTPTPDITPDPDPGLSA